MDGGILPHQEEGEGDATGSVSTEEGIPEDDGSQPTSKKEGKVDNSIGGVITDVPSNQSQTNETENGSNAMNSTELTRESVSGNQEGRGDCEKD